MSLQSAPVISDVCSRGGWRTGPWLAGPPLLLRDTLVKENEVVFRTRAKCCFTLWAQAACFAKQIRRTLPLTEDPVIIISLSSAAFLNLTPRADTAGPPRAGPVPS